MGAVTAEVQVLTAEVRVLMVGSRQVTLSVFRQLDWALPEEIEPFGRVKDEQTLRADARRFGDLPDSIQVVGRLNGQLVRSSGRPGFTRPDGTREIDPVVVGWDELPLIVLAGLK